MIVWLINKKTVFLTVIIIPQMWISSHTRTLTSYKYCELLNLFKINIFFGAFLGLLIFLLYYNTFKLFFNK